MNGIEPMQQRLTRHDTCLRGLGGLLLMFVAILVTVSPMGGCQERVVGRRGIGAEESNPKVQDPDANDKWGDFIWDDEKKKR